MNYSTDEAAKLIGRNKSTILRAIQSGKLSATRRADNSLSIDASELVRVYDLRLDDLMHAAAMPPIAAAPDAPDAVELAVLRERVAMLERESETLREALADVRETSQETVADLRRRLDRAEDRVLALSAPSAQPAPQPAQERPSEAPAAAEPPKASKGFLARFLGR